MSSASKSDFRSTIKTRAFYGSGAIAFAFCFSAVNRLAFPILNLGLGMRATLVGAVLAIGRIWDSFSDPTTGWLRLPDLISRNPRNP
jgi:Na+/melibiose symporter-like transporter